MPVTLSEMLLTSSALFAIYAAADGTNGKRDSSIETKEALLVGRAKQGDHDAFGELVTLYQQRLYFTVIRIVFNPDDANDVVQESFLKAFRNLKSFKEGYRFYTWIYRIAVNTALNFKQLKRHKEDSLDDMKETHRFDPEIERSIDDDIYQSELHQRVREALESVPLSMKTVFVLRVYDQLSYQEIADMLEISLGTVMSRLFRVRSVLKDQLERSGWFESK